MSNEKADDFTAESEIKALRDEQLQRIAVLNDYVTGYTKENLYSDLKLYYDEEVEFNFKKFDNFFNDVSFLEKLVNTAKQKNTHPVLEFIQYIFIQSVKDD
ncbi:MAG: hypothetical protein PHP69_00850 [Candidatus Omnitrophica bacterium]|nr:hypothetical protein [Candidatus Omnitrophota bacterium]MDD5080956.1 hypothetical protein [Candidatus Omnitrophota bacterium]MDD5440599.1 hypothetical protein [Candidatus Omnitrophota bacterium]